MGIWENLIATAIWALAQIILHRFLYLKHEKSLVEFARNHIASLFYPAHVMTITQIPTPQFDRALYAKTGKVHGGWEPGRPVAIDTIVYHWMDGTLASTRKTFQNIERGAAAHFGIEDDNVDQYVKIKDTGFHCGNYAVNQRSVGIEHSAQPGRNASDATYETSAHVVLQIAASQGKKVADFRHIPHNSVMATACPGTLDWGRIVARAKELEAVNSPQVDQPQGPSTSAVVASSPIQVPVHFSVTINAPLGSANFRATPRLKGAVMETYGNGSIIDCIDTVEGDLVTITWSGGRKVVSSKWYKSFRHGFYVSAAVASLN